MTKSKSDKTPSKKPKERADLLEKNFKGISIEDSELHKILMLDSPIGIYLVQNGRFKFVNNKFKEYTGFSNEELLGRDALSLVLPEDREMVRQNAILMLNRKISTPYGFRLINKKGELMWAIETVASITYRGQRATLGNYMDISGQKAMEEAIQEREERFRAIIENIEDGYGEINMDANLTFFNDSLLEISGYTRNEFMGMNLQEFIDQEDLPKLIQALDKVHKTGKASRGVEVKFIRKDGTRRYIETSISLINDAKDKLKLVGFRGIIRDTTARREMEDTIRKLAYYDSLTGLPNRLLLRDRFKMTMAHAKRNKKKLALMMLDLDKFKEVNDTLGHQIGDCLLQRVSDRLTALIRESDAITRMGGDEFVVLLPEISRAKDSIAVAKKILASFQEPFLCNDHSLSITTSIGIAIFPDHGQDENTLMKHADIAMYQAKGKGGQNYQIFT